MAYLANGKLIWEDSVGYTGKGTDVYRDLGGGLNIFPRNLVMNGTIQANSNMIALSFDTASDRNLKTNFAAIEPDLILQKVTALPISTWNFKCDGTNQLHLGPMSQDFYASFGLGMDDKHIATVDEGGVALAAIQGLNEKLEARTQKLEAENAELKNRLEKIETLVESLSQTQR